jgi:putative SOS response-associated peptidase YedK
LDYKTVCGRFSLLDSPEDLAREFDLSLDEARRVASSGPRYNVAPSDPVVGVRSRPTGVGREAVTLRWGLVPHWAKSAEMGARMINARSETVAQKPAFRDPFRQRRCLIPANGFYEWQRRPGGKQPHFICRPGRGILAFAGLWDCWRAPRGNPLESCAILTTKPNRVVEPIHDRMPVILRPEDYGLWLDGAADPEELTGLLHPYPPDRLISYEVSTLVNKPENDVPQCLEPMQDPNLDLFDLG